MNVVITGCSRGIGLELVKKFTNEGHKVFGISRNIQPLNQLSISSNLLFPFSFDIYKGDYQELWRSVSSFFDQIDIVINNAGQIVNKPFDEINADDLQKSYGTNVFGPIYIVQCLNRIFSNKAHIVNIGSMGGFQGSQKFAGLAAYSSAKAALSCLTECLQEEYSAKKWSFNCLCLGAVQTEMLNEAFPGYKAPHDPREMASFIYGFSVGSGEYFKGKVLPVSTSSP